MSTTTIRLPEELKARVARAAALAGTNAHSFILEAIADKADLAEQRNDFHVQADERYAKLMATGKAIGWSDMRRYLEERAAGKAPARPKARKLAKPA